MKRKDYFITIGGFSFNSDRLERDGQEIFIYLNNSLIGSFALDQHKLKYNFSSKATIFYNLIEVR